jgi:electron transfer flavoprotein-quinone oxidoreductase
MMGDGAHSTFELASDRLVADPPQSYTVVRARLDQWLAEKVGEKGGMVVPGMKVDELLRKDGRIVGIRAGEDEIGYALIGVAGGDVGVRAEKPVASGWSSRKNSRFPSMETRWR